MGVPVGVGQTIAQVLADAVATVVAGVIAATEPLLTQVRLPGQAQGWGAPALEAAAEERPLAGQETDDGAAVPSGGVGVAPRRYAHQRVGWRGFWPLFWFFSGD